MGQIVFNRFVERRLQFIDTAAVKTHNVADAGEVADKNAVFVIKFDAGTVAFVKHGVHGVTPISIKNLRASETR